MSASILVLDLLRSHYRGDHQAFRAFGLRLARMTKSESVRKTMLEVIEGGTGKKPPPGPGSSDRFGQAPAAAKSSLLEPLADVSIDDLLLDDDLRAQLDDIVLELAHRDELEARRLRPRSRLLFEGPPGNGKTSSGAAIAHELGIPAYGVSIPSLVSKYIGGTSNNLASLFSHIDAGSLVVFDELDAIGGSRVKASQSADAEHNMTVNTILTMLDRRNGGTLVATTNRADVMDPALLRRFDEVVTFPGPSRDQMVTLARRLEETFKVDAPVDLSGCENFDAVTKRVLREARRSAMAEILAIKAAESEELSEDEENDDAAAL